MALLGGAIAAERVGRGRVSAYHNFRRGGWPGGPLLGGAARVHHRREGWRSPRPTGGIAELCAARCSERAGKVMLVSDDLKTDRSEILLAQRRLTPAFSRAAGGV